MYHFLKSLVRIFYGLIHRIEIHGIENLPQDSGYIIAPNHVHYADPLIIGSYFPGHLRAMAKKELFKNPLLSRIITLLGAFPVDRDGNDIRAIKESLKILKDKQPLLIFPEGTRNPHTGGAHLDGKPGVPLLAARAGVPIVPVTIDSTYKLFSKVRILYHPPVMLSVEGGKKLSGDDFIPAINEILDEIYSHMELRQ